MALDRRAVLHGAWVPDDPDADGADVEVYIDGDDVVFMVMGDYTGEVRILISEFEELVAEMDRLKEGKVDG